MWRFTKSNDITEGFHRKMKLIQRRAYGFRNFENYRTRVKSSVNELCPHNWERPLKLSLKSIPSIYPRNLTLSQTPSKSLKTLVGAAGFEPATR